jgi:hypothetical protein
MNLLGTFIHGQKKLNPRHAKWVEFLQSFTFSSEYKAGKANIIADALSRRTHLLAILETKVLGFEMLKDLYDLDPDLSELYQKCLKEPQGHFSVQHGFLFKDNRLCIPLRLVLVKEVHEGTLGGHFGIQKTLDMLVI